MASSTSDRSTTSYAVLGLLSVRSWTTYELAKQVRRSLNWFWPRAERRIYEEPKALVADGLATAAREFTGARPRTVYGITDAGREALTTWLSEASAPLSTESEAMLKVFFADAGSLEQLAATLDAMACEATERLSRLASMAGDVIEHGSAFPHRLHISALTLRLQLEQEVAVLRWTRWAHEQVHRWRSSADPGDWDSADHLASLVRDAGSAVDAGG
jgi:PadR family transcriptional regulator AphA